MSPLILIALAAALVVAVWWNVRPRPRPVAVRSRRHIRHDVPHVLYHYNYADSAESVYWGISNNPQRRADEHEDDPRDQWWMSRSDRLMRLDVWYPDKSAAFAAERMAVRSAYHAGHRIANYQHNPGRRRAVRH